MSIRQWQRLGRKFILGGGLVLGWAGTDAVWAQGGGGGLPSAPRATEQEAPVRRNYMKDRVIDLPITMEAANRALIQEIHLYVKDQPNGPWVLRDKGNAAQDRFRFQAPGDGEFWFTMVTVDKQGRRYPQDLQNERPGLVVVIDTQRPELEMVNLGPGPEGHFVQCAVRDVNLDNGRVHFFFQGGDRNFRALDQVPGRPGVYCIPSQAVATGIVRLVAEDMAGNMAVREEHLNQLGSTTTPATQPPSLSARVNIVSKSPDHKEPPPFTVEVVPPSQHTTEATEPRMPQRLPSSPGASDRASAPRPNGSEGPHWEESQSEAIRTASDKTSSGGAERGAIDSHKPAPPPATETPPSIVQPPVAPPISAVSPAKRQIVNSARIFLDYQIENSSVNASGAIEVWLTRDQGRTWQKAAEDAQRKNPIGVTLPGEGVFGLTLMVAGPQGPTTGPAPNAAADWWLEVDTTKPTAQITNLQVTHEKGQAIVNLSWNVKDANLGDAPVELYFAATHQGPWLPIAKGLRADGQHRWTPPTEIGAQTHLQLIARDVAGNECICRTTEPVNLVDPTRPRVVIREVRTEAPTAPVTVTPPISARPVPNPVGPPTQPFQIIQSQPRN